MSLLKKLAKTVRKIIPKEIGAVLPGVGMVRDVAAAVEARGARGGVATAVQKISIPGLPGSPGSQMGGGMSMLPALPTIVRGVGAALPAIRQVGGAVARVARSPTVRKWSRRAAAAANLVVIGSLVYDAAGNIVGQVGRRRMNPLNARALRRAISRVKSAKNICQQVERITGGRRRRAPSCAPSRKRC